MAKFTFTKSDRSAPNEFLSFNQKKGTLNAQFGVITFRDKDTNQIVFLIPSFEISGYGETEEKAHEMVSEALNDYFGDLLKLSLRDIKKELHRLGWQNPFFGQQFSKAYVDCNGDLQGFNADPKTIEKKTLVS